MLSALGPTVILGIMNLINLAHGEFMTPGGMATFAADRGVPFALAVIVVFFATGLFGIVLELLAIRRFCGRELGALGDHLGYQPDPGAGGFDRVWPLHAADPDPHPRACCGGISRSRCTAGTDRHHRPLVAALAVMMRTLVRVAGARGDAKSRPWRATSASGSSGSTRRRLGSRAGLESLSGALLAPTTPIAP